MTNKIKSNLSKILLLVSFVMLCFSAYKIFEISTEYKEAEKEYDELRKYVSENTVEVAVSSETVTEKVETSSRNADLPPVIDFDGLLQLNGDIVAWIRINGTPINYPVLKGGDNQYYLNRTMEGAKNSSGSIFMDFRNNNDFSSLNTIIYGHNMKNKSMFASLLNYREKDYYDKHKYVWIVTPENSYKYEIFSAYSCVVDEGVYVLEFESNEYANYLESSAEKSYYNTGVSLSNDDTIITLSTCTNNDKDERYVVHARRVTE